MLLPEQLTDLGEHAYIPGKRLHLFLARVRKSDLDISAMVCTSYFEHRVTGKSTLEIDGFRWSARAQLAEFCSKNMCKVIAKLPLAASEG